MKDYFEDIGVLPHGDRPLASYGRGLSLSLALTLAAYLAVVMHALSPVDTVILLIVCALAQCVVQLVYFLHLDSRESRMRLFILGAAAVVVLILVSGSIWIMFTLNGRMMPTQSQMEQYMNDQGGF